MESFWNRLRNTQGQVSIFIALIFQVLFLFFAMIVNVGLLVNHKINLQNSVDLAAYYGAMKQAESLNAIAHLNYQIRQDWKLLAWRYRVLGGAGHDEPNILPFDKTGGAAKNATEEADIEADPNKNLYKYPALCLDYVPFYEVSGGDGDAKQNTCRDLINYSGIKVFAVPPSTGIVSVSIAIQAATGAAIRAIVRDCKRAGPVNWIMAARFKVAFVRDHGERKKAINLLANGLSGYGVGETTDFRELDGTLASIGIKKTLSKNLTIPNRDATEEIQIYNSLGSEKCKAIAGNLENPPQWLSEIRLNPAFATVTTQCDDVTLATGGTYSKEVINVESCTGSIANGYPGSNVAGPPSGKVPCPRYANENLEVFSEFKQLAQLVNFAQPPYAPSIGFEKNPWCMAYVGVKAKTSPKIPFMPFGQVTLTAKAYSKPFGGRIGPWFTDAWSPQSPSSNGGTKTDLLLPTRYVGTVDMTDENRFPNYSRFPGDKKGLMSRAVLFAYERLLYAISKRGPYSGSGDKVDLSSTTVPGIDISSDKSPSFDDWSKIATSFADSNKEKDILAWNNQNNKPVQMRIMELSAIAPDLFDTTYYSIEPNFYDNYFQKIITHKNALNASQLDLGSDLGARDNDATFKNFNVKKQIQLQAELNSKIDKQQNLYYQVLKSDHVLTSWAPNNMLEYGFDSTKFGKCEGGDSARPTAVVPAPGDCLNGGRTGFSVKLVSGDYLRRSDLQLGGAGSAGPLSNPPPSDF